MYLRRLTLGMIGVFATWAALGSAPAEIWWSFRPLVRPTVPDMAQPVCNPVDAFILANLEEKHIKPIGRADRRTLIRRVTFDLTGLPPTPAEIEAFLAEKDPRGYERLVDRLLASPAYGERQARFWMDLVHFAETNGHESDGIRPNAWRYRDYLIEAFNADTPYARFIQEQIAADALFSDEPRLTPALGFLAAGPWDESSLKGILEGSIDRIAGYYLDRDDVVTTVMNTFQSVTVQCARCHDHKFDPVTQTDYYGLQAVFAGVDRADRVYDPDRAVVRRRRTLRETLAGLDRKDPAIESRLETAQFRKSISDWEAATKAGRPEWHVLGNSCCTSASSTSFSTLPDGSVQCDGPRPDADTYTVVAELPIAGVTALRLELLADDSLPLRGPGRADNGNLHLNEIRFVVNGKPHRVRAATADYDQPGWTVQHAIDGDGKTAWGVHPQEGTDHEAVFQFVGPLPKGELTVTLVQTHGGGHVIGRFRLSVTAATPPVIASRIPAAVRAALAVPAGSRSPAQWYDLASYRLREVTNADLAALPAECLVYAGTHEFKPDGGHKPSPEPRPVHILKRGDVRRPGAVATPGTLSCLPGLPAKFDVPESAPERERRAALARWLTRPDNPLTWRSIANRVWQWHFGRGIVETPNDFGKMGAMPSHPELLDWLAAEFRDSGGSFKRLHRSIVTSSTYQRSSAGVTPADPDNHLLARMRRTRLDAEQVRDAVLMVSGRMDRRMGGRSDQQFVLRTNANAAGAPVADYAAFAWDRPEGHRRSVYRFLFRTLADPFVECLDGADAEQLTPVRIVSVTGPQALALLNDDFVLVHCRVWSNALEKESTDVALQVELACKAAWGRLPVETERTAFTAFVKRFGLANLCRVLLNSDDFLFVD
jgi:hypothetical protein